MQIVNKYRRKYLSWYSISRIAKQKHENILKRKLDRYNQAFLEAVSNIASVKDSIESFHLMNLGAAHTSLRPFIKSLIEKGAKATLLDASDNFFDANKNIRILNKIVADKSEKRNFYFTDPPDSSSLYKPDEAKFANYKFTAHIKTDKTVQDDVITFSELPEDQKHPLAVNYLVMDIQAGELLALQGAPNTFFSELNIIVTETWFSRFYENSPLFEDYLAFFKSKGYSLFDLSPIRDAHNIHIYPYYDRSRFSIGAQQLYSDMMLIKNKDHYSADSLIKLYLSLLIDYRYSDLWDFNARFGSILEHSFQEQVSILFKKVSKIF